MKYLLKGFWDVSTTRIVIIVLILNELSTERVWRHIYFNCFNFRWTVNRNENHQFHSVWFVFYFYMNHALTRGEDQTTQRMMITILHWKNFI